MLQRLLPVVLLAALLVAPASHGAASVDASTATTSFSWEADGTFEGDLAFRFAIEFSQATDCELVFTFAGSGTDAPLRSWVLSSDRGIGHASDRDLASQTHLGDQIEITEGGSNPFAWGLRFTVHGFFAGEETWTAAGFDLREATISFPDEPARRLAPASVDLTCEDPFTITTTSGSQDVVGFTEDHLRGGVGTSEEDETFVDGEQGYALNVADHLGGSFDQDTVTLQYRTGAPEGNAATEAILLHPTGAEHWSDRAATSPSPATRVFDGEPGRYQLTFARVASGPAAELAGIVAGLDPVATLGELA